MPCHVINLGNGTAILCTRGGPPRCSAPGCSAPGRYLCDHPTPGGRRSTCSRAMCARHRAARGALDLCVEHATPDPQLSLLPGGAP